MDVGDTAGLETCATLGQPAREAASASSNVQAGRHINLGSGEMFFGQFGSARLNADVLLEGGSA
jgi:hypothetical protein